MGVGGLAGGLLGAACTDSDRHEWGCLNAVTHGVYSGALVGFPIGVYLAGQLAEGRGDFAITVALPWTFAALGVVSAFADGALLYDGAPWMLGGALVASTSSVVLYELSSYANSRHETRAPALRVTGYAHPRGAGLRVIGSL
jgi:hypothetical protein